MVLLWTWGTQSTEIELRLFMSHFSHCENWCLLEFFPPKQFLCQRTAFLVQNIVSGGKKPLLIFWPVHPILACPTVLQCTAPKWSLGGADHSIGRDFLFLCPTAVHWLGPQLLHFPAGINLCMNVSSNNFSPLHAAWFLRRFTTNWSKLGLFSQNNVTDDNSTTLPPNCGFPWKTLLPKLIAGCLLNL